MVKYERNKIIKIMAFLFFSFTLYRLTYYYIYDTNPINCFIFYHILYPIFTKAFMIVFIHTLFLYFFSVKKKNNSNYNLEEVPLKEKNNISNSSEKSCFNFFLSDIIIYFLKHKLKLLIFILALIVFMFLDVFLFFHRIKIWAFLNSKEKTLPIASSQNTTFYITASIVNMETTIENYIKQMKKLIHYLGEQNVIISIVENGDSKDKTRDYLILFQNYLNEKKILNKFVLTHEIDDPRKNITPYVEISNLRIKYYSELRNKCLQYLYELPNINFDNTKVIFFNDIYFEYEDIINLLSTNNEDYDAVCGLDFGETFYDTWVSIDLDGNSLKINFPYFINREAQDLVLNHKPIRVFSCWNGVIAFKASPLKDKNIQFRHKINYTEPLHILNNPARDYYESECTYLHIDLFNLGYTKKFINPEVRVTYHYIYYFFDI